MQRVLVIDDDVDLGELLAQYLKAEGFDYCSCFPGEPGRCRVPQFVMLYTNAEYQKLAFSREAVAAKLPT